MQVHLQAFHASGQVGLQIRGVGVLGQIIDEERVLHGAARVRCVYNMLGLGLGTPCSVRDRGCLDNP